MDAYVDSLAEYLLAQSWQIALLAGTVGLISFALRNRSAHVRYLLWLIVLAKCLVPPYLTIPLAVLPEQPAVESLPPPALPEVPAHRPAANMSRFPRIEKAPTTSGPQAALSTREVVVLGWLAGVLLFLTWVGSRAVRYTLWLHRRRRPLPSDLVQAFQELFAAFKLKKPPRIWLTGEIRQPFVWGLLRGSVYLPVDFLNMDSPEHCRTILAHEISHVVRFDAAINIFQVLAQAIYWFHPLVWWTNRKIRQEREKCCDEMAVVQLKTLPEHYTSAIVEALATERRSARPIPTLAIVGSVKDIEERIKTMMKPGKKFYKCPNLAVILGVFILALLTVPTALVLTVRAQTQTPLETPTEPEEKVSTSLVEAALGGDLEEVKRLIAGGADVNATSPKYAEVKFTPLMAGANRGHAQVVQVLLENGAEVNATDFQGWTALYYAFWIFPDEDNEQKHRERAEVVKALIASGADVNKQCQGASPLINAITTGTPRLGSVEALLDAGADIHFKDNRGLTPLYWAAFAGNRNVLELILERGDYPETIHLAACRGDLSRVQALLEEGADVNSKDEFGCTPLHWAVLGESTEVARLLITKGADLNVTAGPDDLTPLMAARKLPIIEFLVSAGADIHSQENQKKLHSACSDGDTEVVEFLIDKGADINARNRRGATPLWIAASGDQKEIVELLLEKGADINMADRRRGSTPLWIAVRNGNKEIVELLIKKGANRQAPDNQARTPLDIAIERGHTEIAELLKKQGVEGNSAAAPKESKPVKSLHEAAADGDIEQVKLLIRNGADVNATVGERAKTPLIDAVSYGHAEIVKVLLANGAKVDVADNLGRTPLIHALVTRNSIETIRALVSAGADVNKASGEKLGSALPLNFAIFNGKLDVAKVLLYAGADVNAKGYAGYSPLHFAAILAYRHNHEMLELLLSRKTENIFTTACKGDLNKVKTLIADGTDVNEEDEFGVSLLHWAAAADSPEVAGFLIAKGADVNAKSRFDDRTPLMGAHAFPVIELLVSKNADVNAQQANGWTRLHLASFNDNRDIAEFLIRKGADVNIKGDSGPPLWLAVCVGRPNVIEPLIAGGADINFRAGNGRTPLSEARRRKHEDIVDILLKHGAQE